MNENRHAAVQMMKSEYAAGTRRRWPALKILEDGDRIKMTTDVILASIEFILEMTALTCESFEEFVKKRTALAVLVDGYNSHISNETINHEDLRSLYDRARRLGGLRG